MTRVLYIAGLGRSGSTLLDRLLGQVDGVTAHGELARIWARGLGRDVACACGELFSTCPFWVAVGREAYGGWDRVDLVEVHRDRAAVDRLRHAPQLARRRPARGHSHHLARRQDLLTRLYGAIADVAAADVVVDSSKDVSTALLLAGTPGLDVLVIHLVRDPRGVAHSWSRTVERPDAGAGEATTLDRFGPARVAARYVAYNVLLSAAPGLTSRQLLRYEDLVERPGAVVEAVARHAGLDHVDMSFLAGDRASLDRGHSLGGNPMRFRRGPVAVALDEAWRNDMSVGARVLVTSLTAPLLLTYGYVGPRARLRPRAVTWP